jgi:hypothetical protein
MVKRKLRKHLKLTLVLADLEPFTRGAAICGSQYKTGEKELGVYINWGYFDKETGELVANNYDDYRKKFPDYEGKWNWRVKPEHQSKAYGNRIYERDTYSSLYAETMKEMDCKKCYWFLFRKGIIDEEKHAEWVAKGLLHERFSKWQRWRDIK